MADFTATRKDPDDFNGGKYYKDYDPNIGETGDGVQAETINNVVEAVLYAEALAATADLNSSAAVGAVEAATAMSTAAAGAAQAAQNSADAAMSAVTAESSRAQGAEATIQAMASAAETHAQEAKAAVASESSRAQGAEEANADAAAGALAQAKAASTSASNAQNTADSALSAAQQAQSTANSAQSSAETAQSTAETAQSTAQGAQSAAESAQQTADAAQSAASKAQSTAESAQSTAEGAQQAAEGAQNTADSAQTAAQNAQKAADKAQSTADGAQKAADSAQQTANNAQSSAEDAQSAADEAKQTADDALRATEDSVKSDDLTAALNDYIPNSERGKNGGVATLGTDGHVLSAQLPTIPSKTSELQNDGDGESPYATKKDVTDAGGASTEDIEAAKKELGQKITDEQERAQAAEEANANKNTELENSIADVKTSLSGLESSIEGVEEGLNGRVSVIEGKIPTSASASNKLVDENLLNSSLNSFAAFYLSYNANGDPFPTKASLNSATKFYYNGQEKAPTKNDYVTVLSDESQEASSDGTYPTTRYTYQGEDYPNGQWTLSFIVNSTSFTAAQLEVLNSGITKALVDQISTNQTLAEEAMPASGGTFNGAITAPDVYTQHQFIIPATNSENRGSGIYETKDQTLLFGFLANDSEHKIVTVGGANKVLAMRGSAERPTYRKDGGADADIALKDDITWTAVKPQNGIPKTDLEQSLQKTLNDVDSLGNTYVKKSGDEMEGALTNTYNGLAYANTLAFDASEGGFSVTRTTKGIAASSAKTIWAQGAIIYDPYGDQEYTITLPEKDGTIMLQEDMPTVPKFTVSGTTLYITTK